MAHWAVMLAGMPAFLYSGAIAVLALAPLGSGADTRMYNRIAANQKMSDGGAQGRDVGTQGLDVHTQTHGRPGITITGALVP